MQASNKRPLDENAEMSDKKKAAPTRQLSLLSMFKKEPEKIDTAKAVESLEVVASTSTRDPRDLFPDLSLEQSLLLDLELTTMHYDWLKVLNTQLTQPYFVAVSVKQSTQQQKKLLTVYFDIVEEVPKIGNGSQKDYISSR